MRTLGIVLLALSLTACSGEPKAAGGPPWHDDTAAAAKGGSAGDSPCSLPVDFDLAERWKPIAVKHLVDQGGLDLNCEIDAKPAGNMGFIRVWVGPSGGLRETLTAFVADEGATRDAEYREVEIGSADGVEVTYVQDGDDVKRERAFAAEAGGGTVVVSVSGLDDEEYTEMLPAYLLAKRTFTAR